MVVTSRWPRSMSTSEGRLECDEIAAQRSVSLVAAGQVNYVPRARPTEVRLKPDTRSQVHKPTG